MNTDKFDGSQTGTYSKYVENKYTGFKVFMAGLLLSTAALVVFFAQYI